MIVDQPPPEATDRRPAWDIVIEHIEHRPSIDPTLNLLVIADMRERDRIGRERYGLPLTAGNGRNHLVDAYQEALDLAVYLAAYLDEHDVSPGHPGPLPATLGRVHQMFWEHVSMAIRLRAFIRETSK